MGVETRTSGLISGVQIVQLSGRLDLETTNADSPIVAEALQNSPGGIVIDVDTVQFISSSGLRMLIATLQEAQAADKKLAIIRAKPLVYKIFKVSGLESVFSFYKSEEEAINGLWR